MNVYVESNYILEMVFTQAEVDACEELLALAEASAIQLILPSLAMVEPQETVRRRRIDRDRAKIEFNPILKDVSEHQLLGLTVKQTMDDVERLVLHFNQEEDGRLKSVSARLLEHAHILPMGLDTLARAQQLQQQCDIQLFDAIMVAAVLMDLDQAAG